MSTREEALEAALIDSEYLRGMASSFANSNIPEFQAHHARLLKMAAALAQPVQPAPLPSSDPEGLLRLITATLTLALSDARVPEEQAQRITDAFGKRVKVAPVQRAPLVQPAGEAEDCEPYMREPYRSFYRQPAGDAMGPREPEAESFDADAAHPEVLMVERRAFEQWYATHAFDYLANPVGSRDCGLQWAAWLHRSVNAPATFECWKCGATRAPAPARMCDDCRTEPDKPAPGSTQ